MLQGLRESPRGLSSSGPQGQLVTAPFTGFLPPQPHSVCSLTASSHEDEAHLPGVRWALGALHPVPETPHLPHLFPAPQHKATVYAQAFSQDLLRQLSNPTLKVIMDQIVPPKKICWSPTSQYFQM